MHVRGTYFIGNILRLQSTPAHKGQELGETRATCQAPGVCLGRPHHALPALPTEKFLVEKYFCLLLQNLVFLVHVRLIYFI